MQRSRFAASFLAALAGCGVSTALAQTQILEVQSASLTTYLPAGISAGQGVQPRPDQRGVGIDGSMRAPSTFAWAMAGNPSGNPAGVGKLDALTLWNGSYSSTEVDWTAPAPGASRWVIGRTFNQVQSKASNGYQGANWFQMSQPEIRFYDADSNAGTRGDADVVYVVYGADRYLEFDRTAANQDTFKGKNGVAGIVEFISGTPDLYVYTDQHGTRTTFFGDDTSGDHGDWQVWKIEDAAGNVAFVGDESSATTAVTNGYSNKRIQVAFDGATAGDANARRRYTYDYDTIDSVDRLVEVKVEALKAGSWSSPSGTLEVARVTYDLT